MAFVVVHKSKQKYEFAIRIILITTLFSLASATSEASSENRHAFIDSKGAISISVPKKVFALNFSNGFALAIKGHKFFHLDKNGSFLKGQFTYCEPFSEGLSLACRNQRYGYINKLGLFEIPPQFDSGLSFNEGLAPVRILGKCGFVSKSGQLAIEPKFDDVANFSEGLAPAMIGKRIGFIDRSGNWVVDPAYDYVAGFSDGLALVSDSKRQYKAYINGNGIEVIRLDFKRSQSIDWFDDIVSVRATLSRGMVLRTTDQKLTKSSDLWPSTEHGNASSFREGLAAVSKDGKFGYIDKTGEYVIAPRFDYAFPFFEQRALVKVNGKYGYIDRTGALVIPAIYCYAMNFSEGMAAVAQDKNCWAFINKHGAETIHARFSWAAPFSEGLALVELN